MSGEHLKGSAEFVKPVESIKSINAVVIMINFK